MSDISLQRAIGRTEVFFVGGILNEQEDVQKNVLALSEKCERVITPFWNATWRKKLDERIFFEDVSADFASRLMSALSNDRFVCIIAHSHGAVVAKEALKGLSISCKKIALERVEVYTFGGVTKIPDGYARKVKNYRNDTDMALHVGQLLWDEKENEPLSFITVSGRGEGHGFIEGYLDLAAEKIQSCQLRHASPDFDTNTYGILSESKKDALFIKRDSPEGIERFLKTTSEAGDPIATGLNIEGSCNNDSCNLYQKRSLHKVGVGNHKLGQIVFDAVCPSCVKPLHNPSKIIFKNCQYTIAAQTKDRTTETTREVSENIPHDFDITNWFSASIKVN